MAAAAESPLPRTSCSICSGLKDVEQAYQKYGWPADDTSLPASAHRLAVIRDLAPNNSRAFELQQCPECRVYYLYETDYEFLVNGSENYDYLSRLTDAEAAPYLTEPVDACRRRARD